MIETNQRRNRCILVLGMHRSGTSAATRCLNLVGMDLGSHLLVPDRGNAKGYWEHADAVRINDTLLQSLGLQWWSSGSLPHGWRQSDAARIAAADIEEFVRRDFSGVPLWGVKDPRMCLVAPLWIDVLTAMGMDVYAVFVSRRAQEVARSLSKAHELTVEAGVLNWIRYTVESERATRAIPRALASYDQVLADPIGTLERVGRELGLDWPIPPHQRSAALTSFVDAGLRTPHHSSGSMHMPSLVLKLEAACEATSARHEGWREFATVADEIAAALSLAEYRAQVRLPGEQDLQDLRRQIAQLESPVATASVMKMGASDDDQPVAHKVRYGRSRLEFPIAGEGKGCYRLQPCDRAGYYLIHDFTIVDGAGTVRWSWNGGAGDVELSGLESVASPTVKQGTLCRASDDAAVTLVWPDGLGGSGYRFVLDIERFDEHRLRHELDVLRHELDGLRDSFASRDAALRGKLEAAKRIASQVQDGIDGVGQRVTGTQVALEQLRIEQSQIVETTKALLRRGPLAGLRRRFGRTEFGMRPKSNLRLISAAERRYAVTGNDPTFECESVNFPLMPGWYSLDLDMPQFEGSPARASLYPDYGADFPIDPAGIQLPFVKPGNSRHHGIVRFAHAVHALRFDPAEGLCEIGMSRMVVRRISKLRAGWELFRAWRRPLDSVGKARPEWRSILHTFRTRGMPGMIGQLYAWYTTPNAQAQSYDTWLQSFDVISPELLRSARERAAEWEYQPRISVLVPTYNTDEKWLRRCIDSVLEQAYPNWELCVADDASPKARVMEVLNEYASRDARIHVQRRSVNGHISASSNTALEMAGGEYIALLDHDDELHPMALYEVVRALQVHRQWKLVYTDEDKIDQHGHRYDPYMKPDWNYDLLLSQNCISHLGVYQRDLLMRMGGFRVGFEGSQDWDLALRCIEQLQPEEIGHIAKVLYHWRAIPGSTSTGVDAKDYTRSAAHKALNEHLIRIGAAASVEEIDDRPGNFRVRYRLPSPTPKVTLVIPTRDGLHLLRRCIDSIIGLTDYPDYEIVIVDNQSQEPETLAYLEGVVKDRRVRVLAYDKPFNYSAINNYAVSVTDGALVGLVNNDIEVISPGWMTELASQAMRPDVGAVGAMLYYPDDTIQHAGVVLGVHGVAAHFYCGAPRGFAGQMGRARLVQELSAVTAACLLVRREVFNAVGGLDESLRVAFNDIDFCLRVRRAGFRNLWTPFAELYHHESATRGYEDSPEKLRRFQSEVDYMLAEWSAVLTRDPAYSPNLTLTGTPNDLAFPPRAEMPETML